MENIKSSPYFFIIYLQKNKKMAKKLTQEEYIKQLSLEHPNLELLSEYNGNKNYITVRCKKHDYIFKTKPNWLHSKHGCQKCYDEKRGEKTRKNKSEIIQQARKVHGDKYDYSKVEYVNNKTKVCIICPKHGEFWQTMGKHINDKRGCPKCANEQNGFKKRLKYETFLERAHKKHGFFYKYEQETYKTSTQPMKIICPKHGEFWQTPYFHVHGLGCPFCNESHLERQVYLEYPKLERQKRFKWLGRQSVDFYSPQNNIAIECQGKQHFQSVEYFGGENALKITQERDCRKNTLLKENNIILYYIVDNDVDIEKLPKILYNSENTFHVHEIERLKDILKKK